ncbi:type II toxin-antitoxin system RelE/ParE family toxin [Treponema sp. OMZ 788]|uniref:type II toxin-antitoxin system RelE/ParE family toxin n=1 Tax=Treponema sp. OMZ 788 TaxID=2563664 RepID=UPI0020A23BBE|nr:type II toxin-antitoxin system RelE/ParE family toxin [Treponema sp. OMZ 788]UTC64402.1 type II toxin-antitoxin system RelE/ParE family toxin [Treponema sp. OMZ 788]
MTEEYEEWYKSLDKDSMSELYYLTELLRLNGPELNRPYADIIHGSKKIKNLKELRGRTSETVLRVSFFFDKERKAILLIGEDKKGVNEKKFYKDLIKRSEEIAEKYGYI